MEKSIDHSNPKQILTNSKGKIIISKNGPYLISGTIPLNTGYIILGKDDIPEKWKYDKIFPPMDEYSLCRCGNSNTKPFCDGTHKKSMFDGTETASRKKYSEQAKTFTGPDLILKDAPKLCASAYFCHRAQGTWILTKQSQNPIAKEIAIQEACDCPSGRLVVVNKKNGVPIEPEFDPQMSLIEIPAQHVSGPIWVKGRISIESSDGTSYEPRNRVTLCRCGKSFNKPFCNGNHLTIGFNDGDESVNNEEKNRDKNFLTNQ